MSAKRTLIFLIAIIIFVGAITGGYFFGKYSNTRNAEYVAFAAILNEVAPNHRENVHMLRSMYDKDQNRYWIEFYDTISHLSSLWTGVVVVDGTNHKVLHTETNVQLYSGISPKMAAEYRKAETEIHNEYGDFYSGLILPAGQE